MCAGISMAAIRRRHWSMVGQWESVIGQWSVAGFRSFRIMSRRFVAMNVDS
jgi:hypothetical protein